MPAEWDFAIGAEAPNDRDVDGRHNEDEARGCIWPRQFVEFNGPEEGGFADGQPASPRDSEEQTYPLNQRENPQKRGATGGPMHRTCSLPAFTTPPPFF